MIMAGFKVSEVDEEKVTSADASVVDEVKPSGNERLIVGFPAVAIFFVSVSYIAFHLYALNIQPIETWTFRIVHIAVGLLVGFLIFGSKSFFSESVRSSFW